MYELNILEHSNESTKYFNLASNGLIEFKIALTLTISDLLEGVFLTNSVPFDSSLLMLVGLKKKKLNNIIQ